MFKTMKLKLFIFRAIIKYESYERSHSNYNALSIRLSSFGYSFPNVSSSGRECIHAFGSYKLLYTDRAF